jgi:hypothetical protein
LQKLSSGFRKNLGIPFSGKVWLCRQPLVLVFSKWYVNVKRRLILEKDN